MKTQKMSMVICAKRKKDTSEQDYIRGMSKRKAGKYLYEKAKLLNHDTRIKKTSEDNKGKITYKRGSQIFTKDTLSTIN